MKPEGGRFDEETYARARRFVESGGKRDEEESPKPKAKPAAKRVAKPRADADYSNEGRGQGRINLPGAERTNEPVSSSNVGSSLKDNIGKALAATGIGAGLGLGAKGLYGAYKSAQAAKAAKAATTARPALTRAIEAPIASKRGAGEEVAKKLESDVTAGLRKAMEKKTPAKSAPRKKTEAEREKEYDDMRASDMEAGYKKGGAVKKYAKGGSVKGDGICQRGKTKGTMR